MTFFNVNFDGSVMSSNGKVGLIIRGPNSRLVAAGDNRLFGPSILKVEL